MNTIKDAQQFESQFKSVIENSNLDGLTVFYILQSYLHQLNLALANQELELLNQQINNIDTSVGQE